MYSAAKCIGCGECVKSCPNQACSLTPEGIITDPASCDLKGVCARVCPTLATELCGRAETIPGLMAIIEKERHLFDQSAGGVTFSGGEPLLHPEFLCRILDRCGEVKIHRAVDTCGYVKTATLLQVAQRTDLFLYDFKLFDSAKHKAYTGVNNELILKNLTELATAKAKLQIRIPLIKGVNSDEENLANTARFIVDLPGEKPVVNFLPYHAIAGHKYEKLGSCYLTDNLEEPNPNEQQQAVDIFTALGLQATLGG